MTPQSYALSIEDILRKVFSCNTSLDTVGGIVNADYIRKNPIMSLVHASTYLYAEADTDKRKSIEDFIDNTSIYNQFSIEDFFSFEGKSKAIDGITYELDSENGKEELNNIIEEFKVIKEM